ncbi:MAG TPA: CGNR zinc finger domain-containing protein [Nocardioidaceae bacterium]|nr:CGNR zinc finger domain-containing protein [Nocardioidaceae bacterium]
MDFVRYAELAAALVNAPLETEGDLTAYFAERHWLQKRLEASDLLPLIRLQVELRAVFEASDDGDESAVVAQMNHLLSIYPVSPHIAGHDTTTWHLHVAEKGSSVSALITAECLMGLAMLVVDFGPTRLGVCSADRCSRVFVDTSPNSSRRYCSERCSSRANVAAYRARRKAEAAV